MGSTKTTTLGAWALAGVLMAATPAMAVGQEAEVDERSCRCVDSRGEAIENCRCFRMPDLDPERFQVRLTPAPRARIGVMVGGDGEERDEAGVVLRDVVEGSPAWEGGLRPGDVVVAVEGRSVLEPLEDDDVADRPEGLFLPRPDDGPVGRFVALVGRLEPGEEATVEYLRDGARRRATVVPEAAAPRAPVSPGGFELRDLAEIRERIRSAPRAPDAPRVRVFERGDGPVVFFEREGEEGAPRGWSFGEGDEGLAVITRSVDPCFTGFERGGGLVVATGRCVDGLELQALNEGLAPYFETERGVLVTRVAEGSTLGLRAGDVILSIGDRAVEEPDEVRRILGSYELDEPVDLRVVRHGEETSIRGTRR